MSYFILSEDSEHSIDRVRHSLLFVASLADAIPPGKTAQINPEDLSCLLCLIAEWLPSADDLPFVAHTGEPS